MASEMRDTTAGNIFREGLEGVVAARTELSMVDGEAGELVIRGFAIGEIAPSISFEEMVLLLWDGDLPTPAETAQFRRELSAHRTLPFETLQLLRAAADSAADPMDALRAAVGTLGLRRPPGVNDIDRAGAMNLVASMPAIVAAYWRMRHEHEPIAARPELGHAANFLWMLGGVEASTESVRGLETYLNTVIDHGLNASTFTARVIASTGSDFVSAITGAIGALKGPLHGGAPGPALDMVFEISEEDRAEEVLRRKIEAGERLMGFGHRVYKVRDPRAGVLAAAAERMFTNGGDVALYELARSVEATALRLLEAHKPGRRLQTNVEFYTALLLHGIGFEVPLFTPTFAISRTAGWLAHCFEQRKANRLIRPQSEYVGRRVVSR
jgi:citrate synthase